MEPYLRAIFDFIGISDSRFVYAHNTAAEDPLREMSLKAATTKARELVAAW